MPAYWGHDLRVTSRWLLCCAASACALAFGCGVDDRTLSLGAGSASNAGGTNAGGSGGQMPSASSGSRGTSASADLPLCVYDSDVPPECQTLVSNAGFQRDIDPWQVEDGSFGDWAQENAGASNQSGSIRVLNFLHGEADGVAPGAAVQCLGAEAGQIYDMAADVFIKEGQGAGLDGGPYKGKAGLGIYFFKTADCSEDSIGNVDSPLTEDDGAWIHTEGSGKAPEQTHSLLVRLNTLMPFRENGFEALFDNVFVRRR